MTKHHVTIILEVEGESPESVRDAVRGDLIAHLGWGQSKVFRHDDIAAVDVLVSEA